MTAHHSHSISNNRKSLFGGSKRLSIGSLLAVLNPHIHVEENIRLDILVLCMQKAVEHLIITPLTGKHMYPHTWYTEREN